MWLLKQSNQVTQASLKLQGFLWIEQNACGTSCMPLEVKQGAGHRAKQRYVRLVARSRVRGHFKLIFSWNHHFFETQNIFVVWLNKREMYQEEVSGIFYGCKRVWNTSISKFNNIHQQNSSNIIKIQETNTDWLFAWCKSVSDVRFSIRAYALRMKLTWRLMWRVKRRDARNVNHKHPASMPPFWRASKLQRNCYCKLIHKWCWGVHWRATTSIAS